MAADESVAGKEGAEQARMYIGMGKYGVAMNPDAWDGYQHEREKVSTARVQRARTACRLPSKFPLLRISSCACMAQAHASLQAAHVAVHARISPP